MQTKAQAAIAELHAAYVRATGFDLRLDAHREMQWFEVWRRGIRACDITALVQDNRRRAKRGDNVRSLVFRNFVGNPDYLEEDLAELRARNRVAPVNPRRAEVLQATGRPAAPEPPPARPVGDVITGDRMVAELERLKEELG